MKISLENAIQEAANRSFHEHTALYVIDRKGRKARAVADDYVKFWTECGYKIIAVYKDGKPFIEVCNAL